MSAPIPSPFTLGRGPKGHGLRVSGPFFDGSQLAALTDRGRAVVAQHAGRIADQARENAPEATGELRSSIYVEPKDIVTKRGQVVRVVAIVHAKARHAPFVEAGRKPGRAPPRAQIIRWAEAKGLRAKGNVRAGKRYTSVEAFAIVVAKGVQRFGVKPNPYMRPAIEGERSPFLAELHGVVSNGLRGGNA
jgi:hypothetical protein